MLHRRYDAICLDLDGTLLDDASRVRPRVRDALRAAADAGVRVLVATGRSEAGVHAILEELDLDGPAVVFNGAGVWDPRAGRFLEERVLSNRLVADTLAWALASDVLPVVMRASEKRAPEPRDDEERRALALMEDLAFVPADELPREYLIRITLLGRGWRGSEALEEAYRAAVPHPAYLTHFPLCALPRHRDSSMLVVDVQPPCRGKGEALRFLQERWGIPPERVVAVGDANNDVPMLEAAGLGVAMGNAFDSALRAADRVIGPNHTDAIAELVDELFLRRASA